MRLFGCLTKMPRFLIIILCNSNQFVLFSLQIINNIYYREQKHNLLYLNNISKFNKSQS